MRPPELAMVHPNSRAAWRAWLARHHASSPGVWFVYRSATDGRHHLSRDDAIEEALCYGWADSAPRLLDGERAMLRFGPRPAGTGWTEASRALASRLIDAGRMHAAGLARVAAAKRDGSWSADSPIR